MRNRVAFSAVVLLGIGLLALRFSAAADKEKKEVGKIEPAKVELGRAVDFKRDVYPILEANCIGCHNVAIEEGNLNLEEVKTIIEGGNRGVAVIPKKPDESLLYQLASRSQDPAMPPLPNEVDAHALTPKEVGILKQWIVEGAAGSGSGSAKQAVNWQPLPSDINSVYSVALSARTNTAAAGRGNQIFLYDVAGGRELGQLYDPHLRSLQFDGGPMYPRGAAHRDFVHSLAFSPNGNLLASGGYRVVKLWKRPQNEKAFEIQGNQPATAIQVSPDRKLVALARADNSIQIAQTTDGKVTKTLSGHSGKVTGLAFSPDGSKLYSASSDKTLRGWNLVDGQELWKIESPAAMRDLTVNKEGTLAVTADEDNKLRIWSTTPEAEEDKNENEEKNKEKEEDGDKNEKPEPIKPVRELSGHSKPVTSVALILPEDKQVVSGSEDGSVRIWDIENGRQVRSMNHGGSVTDVAASPNGEAIASVSTSNTAKLWSASDGKERAEVKGSIEKQADLTQAQQDKVVADQLVKVAEDKQKAAEENQKDREEALKSAEEDKKKADEAVTEPKKKVEEAQENLKKAKEELAKKKDDKGLQKKVSDAQKELENQEAELKKVLDAQSAAERALELAQKSVKRANEKLEEAKSRHENAKKHQEAVESQVKQAQEADNNSVKPLHAVAFSADSGVFATAGEDQLIQLWSAQNGKPLDTITGHSAAVEALAFGPDDLLISAAGDKTVNAWRTNAPWNLVATLGPSGEDPLDLSSSPFVNRVLALDFSRDGKLLATGGGEPSRSGELMIWDVAERKLLKEFEDAHSDTVLGVEFSRDGTKLASGAADKFMKTFDVESGKAIRSYEGHTHHVMDVSWKADQTLLASAGADNAIKIWNAETGEQEETIDNFSKQVTSVQFVGTGANVLSGSGDQSVQIRRSSNGRQEENFGGSTDYVYCVAVSPDEKLVIAGGEDGFVRVWNGENGQSLFTFAPPPPPGDETTQVQASTEE